MDEYKPTADMGRKPLSPEEAVQKDSNLAREIAERLNSENWLALRSVKAATRLIAAKLAEANKARDKRDTKVREKLTLALGQMRAAWNAVGIELIAEALALLPPKGGDDGG